MAGKQKPIDIYEIADADPETELSRKMANRDAYNRAVKLYLAGKITEAAPAFRALAADHPDDGLYALYLTRCEEVLANGVPQGWDGVETLDSK